MSYVKGLQNIFDFNNPEKMVLYQYLLDNFSVKSITPFYIYASSANMPVLNVKVIYLGDYTLKSGGTISTQLTSSIFGLTKTTYNNNFLGELGAVAQYSNTNVFKNILTSSMGTSNTGGVIQEFSGFKIEIN